MTNCTVMDTYPSDSSQYLFGLNTPNLAGQVNYWGDALEVYCDLPNEYSSETGSDLQFEMNQDNTLYISFNAQLSGATIHAALCDIKNDRSAMTCGTWVPVYNNTSIIITAAQYSSLNKTNAASVLVFKGWWGYASMHLSSYWVYKAY